MTPAELLHKHLANIAQPVEAQDLSIYADDLVCTFPYAPEGHTQRLEGPAAFGKFLAAVGGFAMDRRVEDLVVYEAAGGAVATYTHSFTVKDTGAAFTGAMVYVADVADGKIVRFREYYDTMKLLKAFGD